MEGNEKYGRTEQRNLYPHFSVMWISSLPYLRIGDIITIWVSEKYWIEREKNELAG